VTMLLPPCSAPTYADDQPLSIIIYLSIIRNSATAELAVFHTCNADTHISISIYRAVANPILFKPSAENSQFRVQTAMHYDCNQ
jgi:hypothetical protein